MVNEHDEARRRLLLGGLASALTSTSFASAARSFDAPSQTVLQQAFWTQPRVLNLSIVATGESRVVEFWANGKYLVDGIVEASQLLRDVHTGRYVAISPGVLDALFALSGWLRAYRAPNKISITSGYRSPERNKKIEGAARDSAHTRGEAADFRVQGVSTEYVARLAAFMKAGGVGYYPEKNFVHVDEGPVRTWVRHSR